MASHKLAIAKASFSAGLLRPDPTSVSRDSIAHFHLLLNSTVQQCTSKNVQTCKQWILENIFQSTARFAALGKYLTALTNSYGEGTSVTDSAAKREPSIKRKRLHLLYLVNDILHHAKYSINDASICGKLQPILMNLLGRAASFTDCPKHHRKLNNLLNLWEEKDYYSKEYIEKLREAVTNASELGTYVDGGDGIPGIDQIPTAKTKSAPFVMPASHGDPSTPWFDLPAGNLMPHIIPNSTRPINPQMIKPLQFVAGPADDKLAFAVKGLLADVQKIFGGEEEDTEARATWDIDELGQSIVLDEINGDILEGEGYYGWSRTFCEKMKRRRKGLDVPGDPDEARDSRSLSRSLSRSISPSRKRRRHSDSDRSRSRSYSPTAGNERSRFRNRSYSRSPRRSSSPRRSISPAPFGAASKNNRPDSKGVPSNIPPNPPGSTSSADPPRFQGQYNEHFAPPPPPPPPSNYQQPYFQQNFPQQHFPPPPVPGQWPPPPPPPPPNYQNFPQQPYSQPGYQQPYYQQNFQQQQQQQQQQFPPYQAQGQWPPPPPPPPPAAPPGGRGGFSNNNGWNNNGHHGGVNQRGRGW